MKAVMQNGKVNLSVLFPWVSRKLYPFLFISVVNSALASQDISEFDADLATYVLLSNATTLEQLHRLKLGEVKSVEKSMAADIALNIVELGRLLVTDLDSNNRRKIEDHLVLLAVMQEKMNIVEWRQDDDVYSILTMAKEKHPDKYKQLNCRNWALPMWIGKPNC